jgi:hypothetical protein
MKRVIVLLISGLLIPTTACVVLAVDGGMPDSDMPTPSGGCSNAIGCHTTRSASGILTLEAAADDGEWNTPGEPGSLKVAVNIDSASNDADIAGILLLDPDIGGNIADNGWVINADPNSNDTAYNYNRMLSVVGDMEYAWSVNSPDSLGTYRVIARMHFDDGGARYNLSDTVEVSFLIGSPDQGDLYRPDAPTKLTSHPNPFSESTTIRCSQPTAGHADLRVYDLCGRLVRTLTASVEGPGAYTVIWDGKNDLGEDAPEGLYLYRLETAGLVTMGKTVLLR